MRYVKLPGLRCAKYLTIVFYVEVLEPLDPIRIVHYILEQTEKNAKCPFRFLRRIVPMTGVTNATLPSLKLAAEPVIEEGFSTPDNVQLKVSRQELCYVEAYQKYGIMPNSRNSDRIDRMEMIKSIADIVTALPGNHKVDLKDQERTILIELHKVSVRGFQSSCGK
jgi:tRNA acetyltransferase TAN1